MIVDTSAIIAILVREPEAPLFLNLLAANPACKMSCGSWIEITAVLVRQHPHIGKAQVDALMPVIGLEMVPVTIEQTLIGEAAYRRYGRGTQHPAKLNFGDCFAYALAKSAGEPLLFKGNDFSETDIVSAL